MRPTFYLLILTTLVWAACKNTDKLLNGSPASPPPPPTQAEVQKHQRFEGFLNGSNYITVDLSGTKDVQVWIKRGESWVPLDQLDEPKQLRHDPYIIIKGDDVIFFNSRPTDYYSIDVWR